MLHSARRVLAVPLCLAIGLALASCGGKDDGTDAAGFKSLDSVQISGDVGSKPEVKWSGQMEVDGLTAKVLHEGDGAELTAGDTALAHIWLGDGYSQKEVYSSYGQAPQTLPIDTKKLSKFFLKALDGQTVGSRVEVAAPASDVFGPQGNPQLGVANKDTVVGVVDIVSQVLNGPDGTTKKAPSWAPSLVSKDKKIASLDFKGTPDPSGKLQSAYLVKGSGPAVQKGQTIVVNYLGQVYDAKKPFDESYSKQPASFPIGTGGVVKGWDKTLVGAPVGSRLIMQIPPKLGYGAKGNAGAGIKGTDTLYFVVDVLGAG